MVVKSGLTGHAENDLPDNYAVLSVEEKKGGMTGEVASVRPCATLLGVSGRL
jgi:hypothetical protein